MRDASAILGEAFPGREIVIVPGHAIADGGGNVHCITMQQPRCERSLPGLVACAAPLGRGR